MRQTHQFLQQEQPQVSSYTPVYDGKKELYLIKKDSRPVTSKPQQGSTQGMAIRSNVTAQPDYM